MKNLDYGIAYAETLEVLQYIPIEAYNKIPKTFIRFMEENCDENSEFTYNIAIPFEKQKLSDDTKNILAMLYRLFWATESEKVELRKDDELEIQKRKELNEKYSPENVLKNRNNKPKEVKTKNESIDNKPIDYKKKNWFQKIFSKIRSLLKSI